MENKKIITVFGATGAQGGGLARAILTDKNSEFSVRAVTRDANSEKAKKLAQLGAKIVVADIDDVQSIKKNLGRRLWRLLCHFLLGTFFQFFVDNKMLALLPN